MKVSYPETIFCFLYIIIFMFGVGLAILSHKVSNLQTEVERLRGVEFYHDITCESKIDFHRGLVAKMMFMASDGELTNEEIADAAWEVDVDGQTSFGLDTGVEYKIANVTKRVFENYREVFVYREDKMLWERLSPIDYGTIDYMYEFGGGM